MYTLFELKTKSLAECQGGFYMENPIVFGLMLVIRQLHSGRLVLVVKIGIDKKATILIICVI